MFHWSTKSIISSALLLGMLALPATVQAVTSTTMRENVEVRQEYRQENREERQETREVRQEERQENREERQVERQERLSDRCDTINQNIDEKINAFDANKGRHVEQYQHLQTKMRELVTYLKGQGADTTKLEADLATLDGKIKAFGQNYQVFIEQLRAARGYTCGRSEGEFMAALQRARELMKVVQSSSKEVWSYYTEVIRPEIVALRQGLAGKGE